MALIDALDCLLAAISQVADLSFYLLTLQALDPLEHRQKLCIRKALSLVQRDATCWYTPSLEKTLLGVGGVQKSGGV